MHSPASGSSDPRWRVVIPFKGGSEAKSRLAERFDTTSRTRLALTMLARTLAAVRAAPEVEDVVVVTGEARLAELLAAIDPVVSVGSASFGSDRGSAAAGAAGDPVRTTHAPAIHFVSDPGGGLNAAVSYGLEWVRREDSECFAAALLGDLPMLETHELVTALGQASHYLHTFVRDHVGTGTTLITLAPGSHVAPAFGVNSAAAHARAGYTELSVPQGSGLRHDVDAPSDLDGVLGLAIEV